MKSWFVYLINGKKIGTWANNTEEARKNLIAEYGDVPMEFIGINYDDLGAQPEKVIYRGMSSVDMMIATGTLNTLIGLRYGR